MANSESIIKLKESLQKGDQKAISIDTGISMQTINRFLNGNPFNVSVETSTKIIKSASDIIKKRKKDISDSEKLINSL